MSELIKRLGPTCAVLGLVLWCCWPYFHPPGSSLRTGEESKLPRVTRSALSPEVRSASERDPFQAAIKEAPAQASFVPFAAMGRLLSKLNEDRQWLVQRHMADASGLLEEDTAPEASELGETLTLNATYLHPAERLAVVDNRIYAEGDQVSVAGAADEPCTLMQVRRDRIVLQYRGEMVVLGYPYPTSVPSRRKATPDIPLLPPHPAAELDPEQIQRELRRILQG